MISASIYNTDFVDNIAYLKGQVSAIDLENTVRPLTDNLYDLGVAVTQRWRAGYFWRLWAGGFSSPHRRELRVTWDDDNVQVTKTTTGVGGTISPGGTGQMVLKVDNNSVGSAALENEAELNSSQDNAWAVSKNPYFRQEFALDIADTQNRIFLGLRVTLGGGTIPSTENHAGLVYDGTNWLVANAVATVRTTTLLTAPSAAARHVFEMYLQGANRIEFWLDAVKVATHTANLPTGLLDWQAMLQSNGGGGGGARRQTIGQMIIQEDTP
jgi:hypothetical protein